MGAVVTGRGTTLKSGSASATVGLPSDLKIDDVLLMWGSVSSGGLSITANSTGWVLLDATTQSATNAVIGHIWVLRVTDTGMSAPELTRSGGDYILAGIIKISDVDERGTVEDAIIGTRFSVSGAGVFTLSHTTFNTTQDDATIVYVGQTGADSATPNMGAFSATGNLDYVAEYFEDGTTTGNGGEVCVAIGYKGTAGATGQLDWNAGGSRGWCKQAVAFRGRVRDRTGPVVTPTPGASEIDAGDSIQIDSVDAHAAGLSSLTVAAIYPSGLSEIIYSNDAFHAQFSNETNAVSVITNGTRIVCARDGDGWPEDSMTIRTIVVDAQGNKTVQDTAYTVTGIPEPEPEDSGPPVLSNFSPADFTIRRMTVVEFDVVDDQTLVYTGLMVVYDEDGTDEIVFDGVAFGQRYQSSVNQRTAIEGGYRFRIRRDDGWKKTPRFVPAMVDGAGNIGELEE